MPLQQYTVPLPLIREFHALRKDNVFKDGTIPKKNSFPYFVAVFTGWYRGEKVTNSDIARKTGIKANSLYQLKNRINNRVSLEIGKFELKGFDPSMQDLKTILNTFPGGTGSKVHETKEGPPGHFQKTDDPTDITEYEGTPIQFLAGKHKHILLKCYDLLEGIMTGTETRQYGNDFVEVPKRDISSWNSTYATLMREARAYTKDWLDLFGHLGDTIMAEEMIKRRQVSEITIDFLQEHAPHLVPKYIIYLSEAHNI